MFANLLQFLNPRDPDDFDRAFVESVQVKRPVPHGMSSTRPPSGTRRKPLRSAASIDR